MLENLPFPRHAVSQVLLRLSLLFGAAVDAMLAIFLLLAPELLARWLGLALPAESLVLRLLGLGLFLLAAFSSLPAYDLVAYSGNIAVALLGRLAGGGILLAAALGRPDAMALSWGAAVEIGLAVALVGLWLPFRRSPIL